MIVTCYNTFVHFNGFNKNLNTLKTAVIKELERNYRFEVTRTEYVTEMAKSLNRGFSSTSVYRLISGAFHAEISDGTFRVKSTSDCYENGLYSLSCFNEKLQDAVYKRDTKKFLKEYRTAQKNHVYTQEEIGEMRNAYGPGTNVVNVVTGKITKL